MQDETFKNKLSGEVLNIPTVKTEMKLTYVQKSAE